MNGNTTPQDRALQALTDPTRIRFRTLRFCVPLGPNARTKLDPTDPNRPIDEYDDYWHVFDARPLSELLDTGEVIRLGERPLVVTNEAAGLIFLPVPQPDTPINLRADGTTDAAVASVLSRAQPSWWVFEAVMIDPFHGSLDAKRQTAALQAAMADYEPPEPLTLPPGPEIPTPPTEPAAVDRPEPAAPVPAEPSPPEPASSAIPHGRRPGYHEVLNRWQRTFRDHGWPDEPAHRTAVALAIPAEDWEADLRLGYLGYLRSLGGRFERLVDSLLRDQPDIADTLSVMILARCRVLAAARGVPALEELCDTALGDSLSPGERSWPDPPPDQQTNKHYITDDLLRRAVEFRLKEARLRPRSHGLPPDVRALAIVAEYPPAGSIMFSHRIIELAVQWHYTYPALGDDHDLIAELAHRALVAYRLFAQALGEDTYPAVPEGTLLYWLARRFDEEARSPRRVRPPNHRSPG